MKRHWLILIALVGAVAAVAAVYWPRSDGAAELRLHGTVEVQEVRLGSRLGGRVALVPVREGQLIEPGHTLAAFEAQEWEAKKEQAVQKLAAARAALDRANRGPLDEEIAEAKAAAEGAEARLLRATNGYRDEQKQQAKADLEAAQAELVRAEADYDRLINITAVAVSKLDLDTARGARDAWRGRVKAARAVYDQTMRGTRTEDVDEAKADLARLTAKYEFIRKGTRDEDKAAALANVKLAQAELDEAIANLRECTIIAPERCVVQTLPVRAGSLVTAGQSVVVVHRADDLWVKVFVPATDLGKVRVGQTVAVTVDSHPGTRFGGQVISISSVSEFTPRNVQSVDERRHQVFAVKVRVNDAQGVFKSGMAAEVFIPLEGDK